jgi:hypothetical protein
MTASTDRAPPDIYFSSPSHRLFVFMREGKEVLPPTYVKNRQDTETIYREYKLAPSSDLLTELFLHLQYNDILMNEIPIGTKPTHDEVMQSTNLQQLSDLLAKRQLQQNIRDLHYYTKPPDRCNIL